MSNKERSKIRRNNYRAWKQEHEHKQQQSSAPATSAVPAPSVEPAAAPQVAQPKASEPPIKPIAPSWPTPGALIPYNPSAPVDVKLLLERLRFGGPEVTDEERIAIAHRLEQYTRLNEKESTRRKSKRLARTCARC